MSTQPTPLVCQICFNDIPQPSDAVTKLCSTTCPAVLCLCCLVGYVSSALHVAYVGALPRMRCPLCLVPLYKAQWRRYIESSTTMPDSTTRVLDEYARLCRTACSFGTPCCHEDSYTHLPAFYCATGNKNTTITTNVTQRRPAMPTIKLPMSLIALLQRMCQQFSRHRLSARELLAYITDTYPHHSEVVVYTLLVRIDDDERRAALLLSYLHVVDSTLVTTCCKRIMCFNCKRSLVNRYNDCKCRDDTTDEIDGARDIVTCPNCHVTLVKVDGCDAVVCLCGYAMYWSVELANQNRAHPQQHPREQQRRSVQLAAPIHIGRRRRRREAQEALMRQSESG